MDFLTTNKNPVNINKAIASGGLTLDPRNRSNETTTGYAYGGKNYTYEDRVGGNGQSYKVANEVPMPVTAPVAPTVATPVTVPAVSNTMNDVYGGDVAKFYNDRKAWLEGNGINEQTEKANLASEMQRQIDASNALYAKKLSEAKVAGEARLGATRAGELSRGTIGGNVATASIDQTSNVNQDIYNTIEQERAMAEASVRSGIDAQAKKYFEDKRAAAEAGFKDRIAFQKDFANYSKGQATQMADYLLAGNSTPEKITEADAKSMGTTLNDIKNAYLIKKYEMSQAENKRQQDVKDKLAGLGPVSVGEGDRLYDRVTGKEIAYNPKTFAPKAGTGAGGTTTSTYVPGANPVVDSWANRINSGQAKLSDITGVANTGLKNQVVKALDSLNNGKLSAVQSNIKEAKTLVEELIAAPGRESSTGVPNMFTNPFGLSLPSSNARDFKAKLERLNALLFLNAIPQMRGLGALTEREGSRIEAASSFTKNMGVNEATYLQELNRLKKTLDESYTNIGGGAQTEGTPNAGTSNTGAQVEYNGQIYNVDANGEMTPAE